MTQPTPTAAPPALLNITLGVMLALMLGWFFHIASGVLVPMVLGLMISYVVMAEAWCYPLDALGSYREWLQDHYIGGEKFRTYITEKAKKGSIPPSVAQLTIAAIETPQIPGY